MMFKVPDNGEGREAWCSALGVDPNLDVVGKSRLLKGAVICEDHFVLEEDVENFMYSRGKVELNKSAIALAIIPKHEIDLPAVEKRSSPVQEMDHDLGVSVSPSVSFHPSPSLSNLLPYVRIIRLSAAEIESAVYPTTTNNGIHSSKPRQTEVYLPNGTPRLSRIGVSNISTRSAPPSTMALKVTPPNVTSLKPLPSKVIPLKTTQNISLEPKVSPSRAIQTNVDSHTKSGFSDAVFKTPHVSASPKAKFTCHHCSHKIANLDAMRRHVALHVDLPYSKPRPRKKKFCILPTCYKTTEGDPDTVFFRAPKSFETWEKWNEIFGIVNIDYTKRKHTGFNVCEDHFYKRDIIVKGGNLRLRKNTLPKQLVAIKKLNSNPNLDSGNVAKYAWTKSRNNRRDAVRQQKHPLGSGDAAQDGEPAQPMLFQAEMQFSPLFMDSDIRETNTTTKKEEPHPSSPGQGAELESQNLVGDQLDKDSEALTQPNANKADVSGDPPANEHPLTPPTLSRQNNEPSRNSPTLANNSLHKKLEHREQMPRDGREERNNLGEISAPKDDLYLFFMSVYEQTKNMPPASQHCVRQNVFHAVSQEEARLLNIPELPTVHQYQQY